MGKKSSRWTTDSLESLLKRQYAKKQAQVEAGGDRTSTQLQELEGDPPKVGRRKGKEKAGAVHRDGPSEEAVDGTGHPQYEVSIVILISDERDRDLDGAVSTILDCLVHSIREVREEEGIADHRLKGFDDSRKWIARETVDYRKVPKGEEGAEIEIGFYNDNERLFTP